jgi:energy-converting hydrogenase Eha subunit F
MMPIWRKPYFVFAVSLVVLAVVFLLIPVPLFDGEVIFNNGISEWTVQTKMTLAQVLKIGVNEAELVDVKAYYPILQGYVLLALMLIGFPALVAYRFHILNKTEAKKKQ